MSQFGLDDEESVQALREWRASKCRTPDPVIDDGAGARLSGEYLRWGYALFFHGSAKDVGKFVTEAKLEEGRQQFDHKAMMAINAIYLMLRRLPKIPRSIEQILRRHEDLVLGLLRSPEQDSSDS